MQLSTIWIGTECRGVQEPGVLLIIVLLALLRPGLKANGMGLVAGFSPARLESALLAPECLIAVVLKKAVIFSNSALGMRSQKIRLFLNLECFYVNTFIVFFI